MIKDFRIKWLFLIHCRCQCRYLFTPLRYLPKEGRKDRLLHDKQNKNLHTLFVNAEQSQRRKCDEGSDILLASIDCASVSQTEVWRYFAPSSVAMAWVFTSRAAAESYRGVGSEEAVGSEAGDICFLAMVSSFNLHALHCCINKVLTKH